MLGLQDDRDYCYLSPEDKARAESVLRALLTSYDASEHYTVFDGIDFLCLRSSTENPPSAEIEKRLLSNLRDHVTVVRSDVLMQFAPTFFGESQVNSEYHIRVLKGPFIRSMKVLQYGSAAQPSTMLLKINVDSRPGDVSSEEWDALPHAIKSLWKRFNPKLQRHILTCLNERLRKANQLSCNSMVNLDDIQPVIRDPLTIPVSVCLSDNTVVLRDLSDVLHTEKRDPKGLPYWVDQSTGLSFSLEDVLPATLQDLHKFIERGVNEARTSKALFDFADIPERYIFIPIVW